MENTVENKLTLGNGATPFTVADAVIRACPEREWLVDVVFYIDADIGRTYVSDVQAAEEDVARMFDNATQKTFDDIAREKGEWILDSSDHRFYRGK